MFQEPDPAPEHGDQHMNHEVRGRNAEDHENTHKRTARGKRRVSFKINLKDFVYGSAVVERRFDRKSNWFHCAFLAELYFQ
jgi:hypothetical protein